MAMKRSTICAAVAVALAGGAMPARAWDIDWSLGLGYEHSDNIVRTAFDPVSGNTITPFFEIAATEEGDTLRANIVGSFGYDYYTTDELDSNFIANAGVNLLWSIQPERWLWSLDNYTTQEPIDVFATQSPDNVQNTNVFSTGPTLLYRFSEAMTGRARVRYINTYAEEADDFNSDRFAFDARLLRDISEVSALSVNGTAETVSLDDPTPTAPDFDRYSIFGGYDWRSTRTTLHLDVGWNWVDFDDLDTRDGPLARFGAEVAVTPISTFDASIEHQLSDTASDLASAIPNADALLLPQAVGEGGGTATVGSDVYEEDTLTLGYTRLGERFTLRASGYYAEEDYENNQLLNQQNHGVLATLDYRISPLMSVGVFANMDWEDFTEADLDSREDEYGLRFSYSILRNLDLNLEASQADRSSNEPTNEFEETRYYAAIIWRRR